MGKRKGIKKRYLITVSSIMLAIVSVLLLRTFDADFEKEKIIIEKEIKAILEFNREIFEDSLALETTEQKAKILRDSFANKISYRILFDKKEDFKNFKYLPHKEIYGFKLLNNAHVGFFHNSDECGEIEDNKDYCAGIIIDVNGNTRPNRFGDDQFFYKVYKNAITQ